MATPKLAIPASSYANPDVPTFEELKARVAQLERVHANAKSKFKVTEKGSISVYTISYPFPKTMTKRQWLKVLDMGDELRAFIKANDHLLFQGKAKDEQE